MPKAIKGADKRIPTTIYYDTELDSAGLDPYQFRIYQKLAVLSAGGNQDFELSMEQMAESCKMSRPTVIRSIKVLVQRRMIERTRRVGTTSTYALLDKSEWLSEAEWRQKYEATCKPEILPPTPEPVNVGYYPCKPEILPLSTTDTTPVNERYPLLINKEIEKREREQDTLSATENIAEMLFALYGISESGGWRIQDQIRSVAIELAGLGATPEQTKKFFDSRSKKPAISFFARDFISWRATEVSKASEPKTPTVIKSAPRTAPVQCGRCQIINGYASCQCGHAARKVA